MRSGGSEVSEGSEGSSQQTSAERDILQKTGLTNQNVTFVNTEADLFSTLVKLVRRSVILSRHLAAVFYFL